MNKPSKSGMNILPNQSYDFGVAGQGPNSLAYFNGLHPVCSFRVEMTWGENGECHGRYLLEGVYKGYSDWQRYATDDLRTAESNHL